MSILNELFSIPVATSKGLFKYGLVSYSMETKFQIYKHYQMLREEGISKSHSIIDCAIHFKVSERYVYHAKAEISEIKKSLANDKGI